MGLFKSKRVLALDIGASDLKLAAFGGGPAGLELLQVAVHPLGLEPEKESEMPLAIMDAVQTILREKQIAPAPVSLAVMGPSAFLRPVKLPPVKPKLIFQTIQYEAQQNVPFPIDEVVWDYQLMGESRHEVDVMLVAIKTEIVQTFTDSIEAAGLQTELVDVAPLALYNTVRYNYEDLDECTLVVDIGARSTNLVFLEAGRLYTRILPIVGTGNTITQQLMKEFDLSFKDAEELKRVHARVAFGGAYEDYSDKVISRVSKTVRSSLTRLHVELERSINFYRTQRGGSPPVRLLLAGGTSVIARTDEFFKEKLKVPVEYLNPFRNIIVHESISADEIGACAHVMGAAVGMGLRYMLPCPVEINLLPPKIAAQKSFTRKQPYLVAAAVGVILTLLLWWFYFTTMADRLDARRQQVQTVVTKLEAVEAQLQPIEECIASLQTRPPELIDLVQRRTQWLRVLDAIHASMPEGMWLVSLVPVTQLGPADAPRSARDRRPRADVGSSLPVAQLLIKGMIFIDKAKDTSIVEFLEQLRREPLFTEKTRIEKTPFVDAEEDYARQFTLLIDLQDPL